MDTRRINLDEPADFTYFCGLAVMAGTTDGKKKNATPRSRRNRFDRVLTYTPEGATTNFRGWHIEAIASVYVAAKSVAEAVIEEGNKR